MLKDIHKRKDRAGAFDGVAGNYSRNRPGYPDPLGRRILDLSGLSSVSHADLLEIGVGPGQATRLFLGRGFRILGIDPGDHMLMAAREALGDSPDLVLERGTFEEWDPRGRKFDLVFSGSAFHWVDPVLGYPKAATLLKSGGSIALFWNMFPDPEEEIWEKIGAAYSRHAPDIAETRFAHKHSGTVEERRAQIKESGVFEEPTVHTFPWSIRLSAPAYLDLLMTYSDHIIMPETRRGPLFDEIRSIIGENGGTIDRPYETVLYHSRVRR